MPQKNARTQRGHTNVKIHDMEAKKSPKGGKKSGRHHHPISIIRNIDKSSPLLLP